MGQRLFDKSHQQTPDMRQLKITNRITSRESVALEKYLSDIGKIGLITAEEEGELARRIRKGDQAALDKMTRANLRFVVSVAKQYQNQGLSLSDLINEGNCGLIKAAKRFDETRGFKFISYAVWWIRQSILQAIVDHARIVRLPLNKVGSYSKLQDARIRFVQMYEREPNHQELADEMGVPVKEIRNMLRGSNKHLSIDAPIGGDEGESTMLDVMRGEQDLESDTDVMKESLKEQVQHGLAMLSPREVDVISAYYGLNGHKSHTLEQIGVMFGLTRERVRQIKERALRRLRKSYHHEELRAYLG